MDSGALVQWNNFLVWLSQRSAPVELVKPKTWHGAKRISYRSRLLDLGPDGSIIVELPRQAEAENAFPIGRKLEMQMVLHHRRMAGDCELLGTTHHQPQGQPGVACYRLGPCDNPRVYQSRQHDRTSTANDNDLKPVLLKPMGASRGIETKMMNLGVGGVGLSVMGDFGLLKRLRECVHFVVRLPIREGKADLQLTATLAHLTPVSQTRLYMGLCFLMPEGDAGSDIEARLRQYVAWLQRRQVGKRLA